MEAAEEIHNTAGVHKSRTPGCRGPHHFVLGAKYFGVARVERAAYHNSGAQYFEDP